MTSTHASKTSRTASSPRNNNHMRRLPPLLKGLPMSPGTPDAIRNVIDASCRQAITTAGSGCFANSDVTHILAAGEGSESLALSSTARLT